jgi:hypothetical protein
MSSVNTARLRARLTQELASAEVSGATIHNIDRGLVPTLPARRAASGPLEVAADNQSTNHGSSSGGAASGPKSSRVKNARAVCRSCGRGFAGTKAFDAHRIGSFRVPTDDPRGRRCLDPAGDPRFEYTSGIDAIGDPQKPREIKIWGLAEGRARVRHLFVENGPQARNRKRISAVKSRA